MTRPTMTTATVWWFNKARLLGSPPSMSVAIHNEQLPAAWAGVSTPFSGRSRSDAVCGSDYNIVPCPAVDKISICKCETRGGPCSLLQWTGVSVTDCIILFYQGCAEHQANHTHLHPPLICQTRAGHIDYLHGMSLGLTVFSMNTAPTCT